MVDLNFDFYAWKETYKKYQANANDGLPMLYSNVRGYYFFRLVSENRTKK